MIQYKNFIKQALTTSLLATSIISAGNNASAAALVTNCNFDENTNLAIAIAQCDNITISGSYNKIFTDTLNRGDRGVFILDNAAPTFNNPIEENKLTISSFSRPIFNEPVTIATTVAISNSSAPVFNALLSSPGDVIISNTPKPEFRSGVTADNIIIQDNAVPFFGGTISANQILLSSNASVLNGIGLDGVIIDAPIKTKAFNDFTFLGSATINEQIGEPLQTLRTITFANTTGNPTAINLKKDIHFGKLSFFNANINVNDNLTLNGSSSISFSDDNNLNLNDKVLSIKTTTTAANNLTISTLLNKNLEIGRINQISNTFDIKTNTTGVAINVSEEAEAPLPTENNPQTYNLFIVPQESTGAFLLADDADVTLTDVTQNPFVIWSHAGGVLTRTLDPDFQENLEEEINNPNVPLITEDLALELANSGVSGAEEGLNRIGNPDALALATTPGLRISENVNQPISDRANDFAVSSFASSQADNGFVAAGSGEIERGAWFNPFLGKITQKERKSMPGYVANYYGGVMGADTSVNDHITVGGALSLTQTDIKHKNLNVGDKTKIDTYTGSLYGTYELSNEWFIQGVSSFSHSNIKNKEIRIVSPSNQIASASYSSDAWGAEILGGYNYKMSDYMLLTPTFGIEYNRINSIKYQETGTTNQNLSVHGKAINRVEGILGMRLSSVYKHKSWSFVPKLQANIRHDLNDSKVKLNIRQVGSNVDLLPITSNVSRTIYNIGVGVDAKSDGMMVYGVEYDARFAHKYVGHQGTLHIRMVF